MTPSIGKTHIIDYFLINSCLVNNQIDKRGFEAFKRLQDIVDRFLPAFLIHKKIKRICHTMDDRIIRASLQSSLYFRASKPLAIISGAGIAGLAASFELCARGFNVVIVEKRKDFSRFNIINLNVEAQVFLKKFNLLEKFEKYVGARIQEHRYVLIKKNNSIERLAVSDVSDLRLEEAISFEPKNFHKLFDQDGIYSVPIKVLQNFLVENALQAGVHLLGDVAIKVISRTQERGVAKVRITADRTVRPDLFFIAEGAHSTTAHQLGMGTKEVTNACTGENWIFGNMAYSGKETFVISLIDTSNKTLRIANVIFNAKNKAINIAVTSDKNVHVDRIRKQILQTAHQVFKQKAFPLEEMDNELLTTISKPVHVTNRTCSSFSMGNIFCIGDSAGCSSPLAGLGGTLGLTLVPLTVRQLLDDYEKGSKQIHEHFNTFSEGYTSRWIKKSEDVKKFCMNMFDKENGSK